MLLRLRLPLEVERPDGELDIRVPAEIDLIFGAGKWRAQCQHPPVTTHLCDSLEEALVVAAKAIAADAGAARAAL